MGEAAAGNRAKIDSVPLHSTRNPSQLPVKTLLMRIYLQKVITPIVFIRA